MKKLINYQELQYKNWPVVIRFGKYNANEALYIELTHAIEGDPVAIATVHLPHVQLLNPSNVLIKSWSENIGMEE